MTTKQEQEQPMEGENSPQTLERVTITSKMESLSASIATSTAIWPKNAGERKKETRKCFKCDKERHIAKDCKWKQSMKRQKIQEESENKEDDNKKQGFGEDFEQIQYERSPL